MSGVKYSNPSAGRTLKSAIDGDLVPTALIVNANNYSEVATEII